jgi:hypothetical protein
MANVRKTAETVHFQKFVQGAAYIDRMADFDRRYIGCTEDPEGHIWIDRAQDYDADPDEFHRFSVRGVGFFWFVK